MSQQPSILLIEDEERLRHYLQILLESEGYRVVTAGNGTEGIMKLREGPFDLVITDLVLPETDGFQIMEYLRGNFPDTVVVAITGYASIESAIEALRKGAYDYLPKPINLDLLQLVIERALEKARMQKALHQYMHELEQKVEERTHALMEAKKGLEQALADLRAAQDQLIQTEKDRALGKLTAAIAHELSNPLTVIIAFAQTLAKKAPVEGNMQAQLEYISEAAFRCQRIVNSLLSYKWTQAPQKVSTDLNALCEKMLHSLAYQIDLSRIVLERRLDPKLPKIMLDPYQLQQVLTNIALNAYQAIMSDRRQGTLVVETKSGEGVVQMVVHDDGPGIPWEHQDRIFDPFFTTKEVGTGLGLSLSSAIIEAHAGKIAVRSTPGEGTTVLLELPIVEPAPSDPVHAAEN
jgi:signal transduction histidine kinase